MGQTTQDLFYVPLNQKVKHPADFDRPILCDGDENPLESIRNNTANRSAQGARRARVPETSKIDDNPRESYLSAMLHSCFDNHQQSVEGASALIYRMDNLTTNPVVEAACDDNSLRRVRTL